MEASAPASDRLDEVVVALPQRAEALMRLFFSRSSSGVSRPEASVLWLLLQGPLRITEIANRLGRTQPGVTLVVNRMSSRGWVERIADASDGRAVLVALTYEGRTALESLYAEYYDVLGDEIALLDRRESESLARAVAVLDRLIETVATRTP
jgi:DNA-binding MarR family transcriptional regulator